MVEVVKISGRGEQRVGGCGRCESDTGERRGRAAVLLSWQWVGGSGGDRLR